ncbi:MAG: 50S ribosomal protein L33 [Clostridia bacterium]
MANPSRKHIILACTECKERNYSSSKNAKNDPERKEINKFCSRCGKHTLHKETK